MVANVIIITAILGSGVPRFCRELFPVCLLPQFFLQACLSIVSLASVPTFHFTTSFCSQNPSPKSQIRGAFLYCKLRLIVMPHPSSQGWKQTYGKVFWRQSCCLMKMTGLRLIFLLPDVEAGPSHVPESWGGTGCLELSIFQLPPDLPCWDYCPRPHPHAEAQ